MKITTALAILEGIGIVLALLDFTGGARKLKNFLDKIIFYTFLDWLLGKGHEKLFNKIAPYISGVAYALFILTIYAWFSEWEYLPYLLGSSMFMFYIPAIVIFIGIPIIYNFLRLISLPPSGIVGTLSLVTALGSLVLGLLKHSGC